MIPLSSRQERPVWDQVADGVRWLLEAGAFLPGEALPPPEQLAWQMALNPGAVRNAYDRLTQQGLLEKDETATYRVAERRDDG